MPRFSWTQPACTECWKLRNGERKPVALSVADLEVCVYCGEETRSGIYVRIDPRKAPFPTEIRDA
jgi:ribosome-binding protein aMBF1 (putative translation factor)